MLIYERRDLGVAQAQLLEAFGHDVEQGQPKVQVGHRSPQNLLFFLLKEMGVGPAKYLELLVLQVNQVAKFEIREEQYIDRMVFIRSGYSPSYHCREP